MRKSPRAFLSLALAAAMMTTACGSGGSGTAATTGTTAETTAQETTAQPSTEAVATQPVTSTATGEGAPVYFTSDISPEGLMKVYEQLNWTPQGKVAVKLSTGEPPASNYLDPELIKNLVQSVDGTIVECNTAYDGSRAETAMHRQVAEDHGFTAIADVDIMDADGSMSLPVVGGTRLKENLVGAHFENYDSYLVLSHFKGHAMAGFGGAIKNISIGIGSREGKCLIHTAGTSNTSPWGGDQTGFTESMAEAGKSVSDYLGNGERIVYVSVLNNISIDCDCDGNPAAPDIHDIGIVASTDPVAIDQACIDLAFAAEGSETLQARVADREGLHTLEHAEAIGLGSRAYQLINVDEGGATAAAANTAARGNVTSSDDLAFPLGMAINSDAFTGTAYISPMINNDDVYHFPQTNNVTFEPGARSGWHSHGGMVMLVTGGVGYYQEEGKPAQIIREGDVIQCEPGVKHWHGATPESWFSQMVIYDSHYTPAEGTVATEEPVTDEQYANLETEEYAGRNVTADNAFMFQRAAEAIQLDTFNGPVYLSSIIEGDNVADAPGLHYVVFDKGVVNNWHTHEGGQILIATDGIGYHQMEGEAVEVLYPGDVALCPPGVKHWHGGSADTQFAHIAVNTNPELTGLEWFDIISPEEYSQLPTTKSE